MNVVRLPDTLSCVSGVTGTNSTGTPAHKSGIKSIKIVQPFYIPAIAQGQSYAGAKPYANNNNNNNNNNKP